MSASFINSSWLWGVLWQSTLLLGLGLLYSRGRRRRSGQAHFVLCLSLTLCLFLPASNAVIGMSGWGLLPPMPCGQLTAGPPENRIDREAGPGMTAASQESRQRVKGARSTWSTLTWPVRLMMLWGLVSVLLLFRLGVNFFSGLRLLARARPLVNERLHRLLETALGRMDLTRTPVTFATADVHCPAIWCWAIHPALLLPEAMIQHAGMTKNEDWVGIFCHELSHMKRRDHLPAIIAELACCLFWWQPLVWRCRGHLHRLSDEACDCWVVTRGQPAADYAELLLNMAAQPRSLAALSMVSSRKGLRQRLEFILNAGPGQPQLDVKWAAATTLLAFGLTTFLACVQPRESRIASLGGGSRDSLLANAGMEAGEANPMAWSKGAPVDGVEYLWDHEVARSGKSSLCLRKTADRYFPIAEWTQELPVTAHGAGRRLRMSGWVRAEKVHKAILDVQFLDAGGEWRHQWAAYVGARNAGDPPADHDWKQYDGVVDLPEGTKEISVGLQLYGPGTVWFDDIELSPVDQTPEANSTTGDSGPLAVAQAFFTALAAKDAEAALNEVLPEQRELFRTQMTRGLPPVPAQFSLKLESVSEEKAQAQIAGQELGLDLIKKDGRWWVTR